MLNKKILSKNVIFKTSMLGMTITLTGAQVYAQEANDTPARNNLLEEVLVTAQKRSQSVLDVGITVSVLDENSIREKRVATATEAIVFTPSATVKENIPGLMPILTIRGIGLNDFNATNNPAAGVYVDEIALSSLALLSSDFYDLERIEILKGPQGTLYGKNSTAGAMNIITAKPNLDESTGYLSTGVGNYDSWELEGAANIATSNFAVRLSAKQLIQDEGYYFDGSLGRDVGRRDVTMGRAQFLWEPTDQISALLKIEKQKGDSELGSPEFFGVNPTATERNCPGSPGCTDNAGYSDTDGDPFRGAWSVDPDYEFDQTAVTVKIEIETENYTISSIMGFIDFDRSYAADVDSGPLPQSDFFNTDEVSQFSQELRLTGSGEQLDWSLGVFYTEDDIKTVYEGDLVALVNTTTTSIADQETTSAAIFGNIEWVLTDTVSLVTGLRYTSEEREHAGFTQDNISEAPISFLTFLPPGSTPVKLSSVDDTIEDKNWSWKLGANWSPNDNTLVYSSISQGNKSGGFFAGITTNDVQLQPYEPEKIIAYEIGAKGTLADVGILYEASVFYYDYSDVQTFIRDTSGALPVQRLGNVDGAEVFGAELTVGYQVPGFESLVLNTGIGYLETELGEFDSAGGIIESGNDLPDAPETSFLIGLDYSVYVSAGCELKLSLDGRYQSDVYRDAINDPLIASDSYWISNGRISLSFDNGLDIAIWGKNIADKEYTAQGLNQQNIGYGSRAYGSPRTFGATISKFF